MNCPLCGAEMEEQLLCPNCGTPLVSEEPIPQQPEPAKSHPGIYYENLLAAQETYAEEHKPPKEARFEPAEKRILTGAVILLVLIMGLTWIFSGTHDPDAVAIEGKGDIRMDNRTFSIYYQSAYQSFVSQYGESVPFNTGASLKKQYYNVNEGYTWEDYFIAEAFSDAAITQQLVAAAKAEGFSLASTEELDAAWESLTLAAEQNRMTPEAYLKAMFGDDMTEQAYRDYLQDGALAQAYSEFLYYSHTFSDAEIEAYYHAHSADYGELNISAVPNVNLRHILFLPDDDSDEALETARVNAESALAQCGSGGPEHAEEIFLNLVPEYSKDSGSSGNGGLLENVAPGSLGGEFDGWCFDEAGHEYGDMAVVKSRYGYHVVYFVGYGESYQWKETVLADMRSEALGQDILALSEAYKCSLTRFASASD